MGYRPVLAALTAGALVLTATGCTAGNAAGESGSAAEVSDLAPSFAPEKHTKATKAARLRRGSEAGNPREDGPPTPAGSPGSNAEGGRAARDTSKATNPTARRITPSGPRAASTTDSRADVSHSLGGTPSYADLTGARLVETGTGFELRVDVAGVLPQRQGGDGKTMNVASFYDVDGDGAVDYEIWANLADDGWGPSYRDNRGKRAAFMEESGVDVAAEGQSLVFRFPATHLDGARSFRWSVASEWGSYETISTSASARDYAPESGAVSFPG